MRLKQNDDFADCFFHDSSIHPHSEFVILFPQRWVGLHSLRTTALSAELPAPHPTLLSAAASSPSSASLSAVDQQIQQIWCFELYQSLHSNSSSSYSQPSPAAADAAATTSVGVWWRVSISIHNGCAAGAVPGPVRSAQAVGKGLEGVISIERWETAPTDSSAHPQPKQSWSHPLTAITWLPSASAQQQPRTWEGLQAQVQTESESADSAQYSIRMRS